MYFMEEEEEEPEPGGVRRLQSELWQSWGWAATAAGPARALAWVCIPVQAPSASVGWRLH